MHIAIFLPFVSNLKQLELMPDTSIQPLFLMQSLAQVVQNLHKMPKLEKGIRESLPDKISKTKTVEIPRTLGFPTAT